MVAEDDETVLEPPEQTSELRLPAPVREQVAAHQHQVGLALGDPVDRPGDRPAPARGKAEMEIAEMGDAQAVELLRQVRQAHL